MTKRRPRRGVYEREGVCRRWYDYEEDTLDFTVKGGRFDFDTVGATQMVGNPEDDDKARYRVKIRVEWERIR